MDTPAAPAASSQVPPWQLWLGRGLGFFPVLALAGSAIGKLSGSKEVVEAMGSHSLYPPGAVTPIGLVELLCAVLYAVPQTSVVGAILVTGYLGGAVATHV